MISLLGALGRAPRYARIYQCAADDPDRLDPSGAHTILTVPKKSKYRNGGTLAFGPDGYLYVSVGDDEQSSAAQEVSNPYGKILRIDVTGGDPYTIPATNPFANQPGAAPEIWSYGLRNPWRFSFDRQTGDLWIGDVGEANWEEVDLSEPALVVARITAGHSRRATTAIPSAAKRARRPALPSLSSNSTTT